MNLNAIPRFKSLCKQNLSISFALLSGVLLLSGCATRTYSEGGETAGSDLIKVAAASHSVTIVQLDGKELESATSKYLLNGPLARPGGIDIAYVKPGRHKVGLFWKNGDLSARSGVWFVAEPGKSYIFRCVENHDGGLFRNETVKFWVEEAGTGNKVGGLLE